LKELERDIEVGLLFLDRAELADIDESLSLCVVKRLSSLRVIVIKW
jgi:hypothetical protein